MKLKLHALITSQRRTVSRIGRFLIFFMLPTLANAATGNVNITPLTNPLVVAPNSSLPIRVSYVLSSDTTPSGVTTSPICITNWNPSGKVAYSPGYWNTYQWVGTWADFRYKIDGKFRNLLDRFIWTNVYSQPSAKPHWILLC